MAERFRAGSLDTLDIVRQYGPVLDWDTGELLPETTHQFRQMLYKRAVAGWKP